MLRFPRMAGFQAFARTVTSAHPPQALPTPDANPFSSSWLSGITLQGSAKPVHLQDTFSDFPGWLSTNSLLPCSPPAHLPLSEHLPH